MQQLAFGQGCSPEGRISRESGGKARRGEGGYNGEVASGGAGVGGGVMQ